MSDFFDFDAGMDRLEREDDEVTASQTRKRGMIKAGIGLLVFLVTLIAFGAFAWIRLSSQDDSFGSGKPAPSFWGGLLYEWLKVIVGIPMVIGLFAMILGVQQAVFGRPWSRLRLTVRVNTAEPYPQPNDGPAGLPPAPPYSANYDDRVAVTQWANTIKARGILIHVVTLGDGAYDELMVDAASPPDGDEQYYHHIANGQADYTYSALKSRRMRREMSCPCSVAAACAENYCGAKG